MAANPKIIPPRIPFLDPRTGTIAREWFHWLLAGRRDLDDAALMSMLSSFDAQATAAQARETALEATLLASLPAPQHDFTPEIEAVRLASYQADLGEIEKRINDAMLQFAMVKPPSISDHGDLTGLADDDHTQYLLVAGTRALTGDWDAGSFEIRAQTFESDVVTGTAPLVIASTTKVTNLNADLLDDQSGAYYLDSANFTGTNWTDLTDGGTTTLHTHTSGTASAITVANEATDTSCYLIFTTAATGDLGPKSNANMTFNSSTGVVTFASSILTTTDINGGTIDNAAIGGSTPAAGAFTTISASGQITSTVTTGTAPLVIASTTKVANLNVDSLDDQSGAYYLDSANFTGTNWTDLTDAGATTLHKHDHGGMDGLTDDDHGHYWNAARGAARVSLRI